VVRLLVVSISWPPPQTQGGSLRPVRPAGEADGWTEGGLSSLWGTDWPACRGLRYFQDPPPKERKPGTFAPGRLILLRSLVETGLPDSAVGPFRYFPGFPQLGIHLLGSFDTASYGGY